MFLSPRLGRSMRPVRRSAGSVIYKCFEVLTPQQILHQKHFYNFPSSLTSGSNSKMSKDTTKPPEESTFKSYTPALAKAYAAGRESYHENLFKVILDKHRSTGGAMQVLLDVGCGPGNSIRPLAKHFDSAFGIDPSPEMISTAKNLSAEAPEETASGKSIIFCVRRAEDMDGPFRQPGHGVDLLTSGTAVSYVHYLQTIISILIWSRYIGSTCHDSGRPLLLVSSQVAQ